jgi:hypothetical protein
MQYRRVLARPRETRASSESNRVEEIEGSCPQPCLAASSDSCRLIGCRTNRENQWIVSAAADRCGRRFTDPAQSVGAETTDPPNEASPVQEL